MVLSAGLGVAALNAGCYSTGGCWDHDDDFRIEVEPDGRDCEDLCAEAASARLYLDASNTAVVDDCELQGRLLSCEIDVTSCGEGRPPAGLVLDHGAGDETLGDVLARMAALEAASVAPFLALADGLRALGAPSRLVRGARAAARDEVRHARGANAWRRRFGAAPRAWHAPAPRHADLEALAIENRVHGVVAETWGAVLLAAQAQCAADPRLRRWFAAVARDEARHSALAVAIDRWAATQLDAPARRRLADAERHALAQLGASIRAPAAPLPIEVGRPQGPALRALWKRARAELWS